MLPVGYNDALPARPGATPELSISATGLNPGLNVQPIWLRMTASLVSVLQYSFASAPRIEDPNIINRVWTNDPTSPIVITSLAEWKPQQSSEVPCILVDRLDQSRHMEDRGIGDQLQGIRPGVFEWLSTGQHVVHVIGGREGEAEVLAWQVWRILSGFAPVIRRALCLVRFLPMGVGKRTKLSEGEAHKDLYTSPVTCMYGYWQSVRVYPKDEVAITSILTGYNPPLP